MNTISDSLEGGRVRRRKHSPEFKAHVVAACCKAGASTAAVALMPRVQQVFGSGVNVVQLQRLR